MGSHEFQLDLGQQVLRVGQEELLLHSHNNFFLDLVLAEEIVLPERSETVTSTCLKDEGVLAVIEPGNDDNQLAPEILEGKTLVTLSSRVPVQLLNINQYPVTIKKGSRKRVSVQNGRGFTRLPQTQELLGAMGLVSGGGWLSKMSTGELGWNGAEAAAGCSFEQDPISDMAPSRQGIWQTSRTDWEGPYIVKKQINYIMYRVSKLPNEKPKVVCFNRLAPYEGTLMNKWQVPGGGTPWCSRMHFRLKNLREPGGYWQSEIWGN
ncbi:hypothetical protein J437_LFUL019727 [Ladona fulva]|nr:hypothetical protein J437_LFUL019727 [Ladona fulva]